MSGHPKEKAAVTGQTQNRNKKIGVYEHKAQCAASIYSWLS
jgi:hypothetical protein